MSTRRSSQPPPSRRRARTSDVTYDTYYDRRDEITTNDAPAWEALDRRTSNSRRPKWFNKMNENGTVAPSVKPSDSISSVRPRKREGGTSTARRSTAPSRRPPISRRYSSEDGSSRWSNSRGAALTTDNIENLNEVNSQMTNQSRRTERKASSAVGDPRIENWRNESGTVRSQSVYARDDQGSRSQAKSTYKSVAATSKNDSNFENTAIAAGAGAVAGTQVSSRRRRTTDDYDNTAQSRVTSRHASQAPPTTTGREVATVTSGRQDLEVTRTRPSPPSMPGDFGGDGGVISRIRSDSPPEMEWERRVRTREYRRPSDGRMVLDRECLVRRVRVPEVARVDEGVQA